MNLSEMYQEMGIDQDVYAYGQKITGISYNGTGVRPLSHFFVY